MTMIDVKLMTREAYLTLRTNSEEIIKEISNHPSDSTWLKGYLKFEPYETKKYQIEDFELESGEDKEYENAITLYEHLKDLPRYILCDTRFWAWITFEKAYKQAISELELKKSIFELNWLPANNSRRYLMLGVISRSYFKTEISVCDEFENPYELTQFIFQSPLVIYRNLVYRNTTMVKNYTHGVLFAMKNYTEQSNEKLTSKQVEAIMTASSKMGSVMLIDTVSMHDVYEYMMPRIESIVSKVK